MMGKQEEKHDIIELKKGNLTIYVSPDIAEKAKLRAQELIDEIRAGGYKSKLTEAQILAETDYLIKVSEKIVDRWPDLDIFEYLPLTKDGRFPGTGDFPQTILIADSKCEYVHNGEYFAKKVLQARLDTWYPNIPAWLSAKSDGGARHLVIDWFNAPEKKTPVFDRDLVPSKPEKTRLRYLKDDQVKPGYVYEDKNGTRYLYLGKLDIDYACMSESYKGKLDESRSDSVSYIWPHRYLKVTKKVQAAMDAYPDINRFVRAMSLTDKLWQSWLLKCSNRDNPRKFVREVAKALDFANIHEETFVGAAVKDGKGERHWLEYTIKP